MENDYNKSPIEGFGKKMLLKQGWFSGRGIGKIPNGEITPYSNYTGRGERNGLGSEKELINKQKSLLKLGDKVEVIRGKHQGVIGTLLLIEEDSASIEIENNTNSLKVPITILKKTEKKIEEEQKIERKEVRWIVPDLIVRVRNKLVYKGSIYGCKGIVEDVMDKFKFTVNINGKIYEDLIEKDLETTIPVVGKDVRIVRGGYQGEVCKLLERNKRENVVTVQMIGEIILLKQDDVCDFIKHS